MSRLKTYFCSYATTNLGGNKVILSLLKADSIAVTDNLATKEKNTSEP